MTWWEAALLGVIQGFTEFLPVSSSGHLVIVQEALGVSGSSLTFDVVVHLGSLVAVLIALKDDWLPMLTGAFGRNGGSEGRRRLLLVVMGSVPIAIVGLLLKDQVELLFQSAKIAGIMLLVTGGILWLSDEVARRRTAGRKGEKRLNGITLWDALLIGCGQALAVLPGLSRSGATIGTGLMRGIARESAARFAFLLSIPAILGASILELPALASGFDQSAGTLLIGAAAAAVSGYLAIRSFLRFLRSGSLKGFAIYTWAAGLIVLLVL